MTAYITKLNKHPNVSEYYFKEVNTRKEYKSEKRPVIIVADTGVYKRTVMVKAFDTFATCHAVYCAGGP